MQLILGSILEAEDLPLGGEPMLEGILADSRFAFFSPGSGGLLGVTTIGVDLRFAARDCSLPKCAC
jgi:hypothetical protein